MATIVRGKNLEITPALKDHVEKQEKKVTKYFDNEVNVQALLSVEKDRKVAEITLKVDGVVLRGVEGNDDMYAAIDLVYDKLVRQIHKYKTRIARPHEERNLQRRPSSKARLYRKNPLKWSCQEICRSPHGCGRSNFADEPRRPRLLRIPQLQDRHDQRRLQTETREIRPYRTGILSLDDRLATINL